MTFGLFFPPACSESGEVSACFLGLCDNGLWFLEAMSVWECCSCSDCSSLGVTACSKLESLFLKLAVSDVLRAGGTTEAEVAGVYLFGSRLEVRASSICGVLVSLLCCHKHSDRGSLSGKGFASAQRSRLQPVTVGEVTVACRH